MSVFEGVTFPYQRVTAADDAILRRAIFSDSVISGCQISYAGTTLTLGAGFLVVCGRQIRHPNSENWAVNGATSGYAQLVLTIDVSQSSTEEEFAAVSAAVQYAEEVTAFPALTQQDINTNGTIYQAVLCTVSLDTSGIAGIYSQIERSDA